MKTQSTAAALSLALALLGILGASPAYAVLVTTTASDTFTNLSAGVTDPETAGATSLTNVSLGTSSVSQFNSSLGVLTGATLNVTSTRTQTTQVSSTDGPNNGNNNSAISSGTGSSTVGVSASGASATSSVLTQTDDCTAGRQEACTGTASTSAATATNLTATAASANLNSYVGSGTVAVARTASTVAALQGPPNFTGAESTTTSVNWSGSVSATYEYLLHAASTFDGINQVTLTLDFGTLQQNAAAGPLSFSIFNAAGDRVGLDLDSILGSGDTAKLSTSLATFLGLAAGSSSGFLASFDTSSLGSFAATYTLGLSDANVGASSSRLNYVLTLNLLGTVIPTNSVPEPAGLALLGLGLLGLGVARRRKAE